jgi:hypothetical protein
MGFLNGLKKLFGFGESTTETVEANAYEVTVVEEVKVEEVKQTIEEEKSDLSLQWIEGQIVEKVESPQPPIETQSTTVKDIKSKARKPRTETEEQSTEKPKKSYRRPRPKKKKPAAE